MSRSAGCAFRTPSCSSSRSRRRSSSPAQTLNCGSCAGEFCSTSAAARSKEQRRADRGREVTALHRCLAARAWHLFCNSIRRFEKSLPAQFRCWPDPAARRPSRQRTNAGRAGSREHQDARPDDRGRPSIRQPAQYLRHPLIRGEHAGSATAQRRGAGREGAERSPQQGIRPENLGRLPAESRA